MTQLAPRRFEQDAAYVRNIHTIIPEVDTPMEAILDRGYWAHVAQYLKPWDRIEVRAEDGSYYAELIVMASGKLFADVQLLAKYDLVQVIPGAMDTTPEGYYVKWRGTLQKWCVLRDGTTDSGAPVKAKDVMREGFDDEATARRWLADFLKTVPQKPKPVAAATPKKEDVTL